MADLEKLAASKLGFWEHGALVGGKLADGSRITSDDFRSIAAFVVAALEPVIQRAAAQDIAAAIEADADAANWAKTFRNGLDHAADCCPYDGEVLQEARTAHHLLDMAQIPRGKGYSSDIDARTYLAVREIQELGERLDRIATWHSRESGPGGLVGDYCTECGQRWPCETRQMADGSHPDVSAQRSERSEEPKSIDEESGS